LPRAVAQFCQAASKLFVVPPLGGVEPPKGGTTNGPAELLLKAHAGNGIVIGHLHGDLTLDRARTMLERLQEAATAAQGNVVILRCPAVWKASLPVWGAPRPDAWLMRAIKEELDPRRLFNPGRFVDGI
jgi:glycolate oxidase FAD binding subunit